MAENRTAIRPPGPPPLLSWVRRNLFSGPANSVMTVLSVIILYTVVVGSIRWIFFGADWSPITDQLLTYLVGQYPRDQLMRVGASLGLIAFLTGVTWGRTRGLIGPLAWTLMGFFGLLGILPSPVLTPNVRGGLLAIPALVAVGYALGRRQVFGQRVVTVAWLVSLPIVLYLLRGFSGSTWLPGVRINLWGGLLVTMLLAVGGIILSFPFGVLLALGRRSSLPVLSFFSTAFIEIIRGVPLISLLFLFSLLVPLFLPVEMRIDRILRALVGMIVFSAAYTAENVRGGLQAIPSGQYEAARALGLRNVHTTVLIVLPQALRLVIPAIVGQFISLFKDTTLAAGIGVLELLQAARSILQGTPEYLDNQAEVYIFVAVVFWIFSYSMSVASRRLEGQLGVGER